MHGPSPPSISTGTARGTWRPRIRSTTPSAFRPEQLIGSCIDIFHKKPEYQRRILADPTRMPHQADIHVGRLIFHNAFDTDHPTSHREAYRAELLRDLAQRPPKLIVIARRNLDPADSINEANVAARFPQLAELLARSYHPVDTVGSMIIQLRN